MGDGKIDLAIILAGGRGMRLRPLTDETPKPLLNLLGHGMIFDPTANRVFLAGYTILDWQLDHLHAAGVKRAVLAVSYMADRFSYYCGREVRGVRVDCSSNEDPERPLGTWGAVRNAIEGLSLSGPAFILNGDIVTDADLASMPERARVATIMVVRMRSPYGIVDVGMDGLVLGFREKPALPFLMNGGIYRVEDLKELAEWGSGFSSLENEVFPTLAHAGLLGAWPIREDAFWRSVDTMKDYQEVLEFVASRGYTKDMINQS